jgi:hypothetical protein
LLDAAEEALMATSRTSQYTELSMIQRLQARLNGGKLPKINGHRWKDLQFIDVREHGGTVFVYVITCEKPLLMEDSIELFPSDELVTKIRLLTNGGNQ